MPVEDTSETTTDQEVDTSTNEEAQDTDVEQDLENDDTSFEDFEDDETEETESDEQNENDADTDQQDDEEGSEEDEATEDSDEQSDDTEETELSEEQKRKEHNREMAERRLEAKRQREQSIEDSQREYLESAKNDDDLALKQVQVQMYNIEVEKNTNKLTNDYERAIKDFDILRDQSPQIQSRLDRALDAFQAQSVELDAYGNPTNIKSDLYKYLQEEADSITQLTAIGKREQLKSKGKEKSKTFTQPVRAPKQPKSDPDIDGFDEEANRY